MLEQSRRQGASIFVYLIFSLLIVIFVINFNPGKQSGGGCTGSSNVIISVDGKEATQTSYHIYYSNPYNRNTGAQHRYAALEQLIRRELLAQEAERRGMRVNSDLVEDEIKKGYFYLAGQRVMIPGIFDEDGLWNLRAFKGWVGQLNVSKNSYIGEQKRGLLASMMAQLIEDSVQISRDEALTHFLFEKNTVQYDVVAFKPESYRAAMKLTDADVDRFLTTHGSEVEARYKADERTYKGTKPALKLRQIFIAKLEEPMPEPPVPPPGLPAPHAGSAAPAAGSAAPAGGPAAGSGAGSAGAPGDKAADKKPTDKPAEKADKAGDKTADKKPADKATDKKPADKAGDKKPADKTADKAGDKKPAKPVGMKIEEAKAKLEAARTAIAGGKQKFADAAKQLATDDAMKASGGDLGWRTTDNAMLGDKAVSDAVKTLKVGDMTPVIATDRGAYLVIAEAERKGDLTYDQVKHEIAKELARDVWSKEAAKRAALSALDKARAGTAFNLDQLYEKEQAPPQQPMDVQQLLNDPNMSDEDKQRILQMLMQQQQQKRGAIVVESKDQLAAWYAQADGAGSAKAGGAKPGGAAAGGAATGSPPPGAPKAGAAGSAQAGGAGSAASSTQAGGAAAAGSATKAAGSAASAPATGSAPAGSAPVATDVTPSKDQLPEFADVAKPSVARFGPAPRSSPMAGIGTSKDAATSLFEELTPGMLAKKVYEADNGYVVMQLISRSQPKVEDFEKDADHLVEELRKERGQSFLESWLKERCEKLAKDNRIHPNPGLLRENDEKGNPLPVTYKPCISFR